MKNLDPFIALHHTQEGQTLGDPRGGILDGNVPVEAIRASEQLKTADKSANSDEGWALSEAIPTNDRGWLVVLMSLFVLGLGFLGLRKVLGKSAHRAVHTPRSWGRAKSAVTGGHPEDMNGM